MEIGVITDEVSRDLRVALEQAEAWGVRRFELRMGMKGRFPFFTPDEERRVEGAMTRGALVTAVSPGILKGAVEDEARLRKELEDVLPRSIEGALRFQAPLLIVFGFERYEGEPDDNRVRVLRTFERVAEAAAAAGLTVAVENEPGYWVDRPLAARALLEELGHPALRLNWDPANLHWGGKRPDYEDFLAIQPYLANLHLKDYTPNDEQVPWRPLGQGATPWDEILAWILAESPLEHATLETHCEPLIDNTRRGLAFVRGLLDSLGAGIAKGEGGGEKGE